MEGALGIVGRICLARKLSPAIVILCLCSSRSFGMYSYKYCPAVSMTSSRLVMNFCAVESNSCNITFVLYELTLQRIFSRANCNIIYTCDINSGDLRPKKCP